MITYLIVISFLLVTLVLGLWAGKDVKTMKDYVLGNRPLGIGLLTMSFLSTYIGGWDIFHFPSDVYADGITHLVPTVLGGVIFCLLFIAWFIAPKMVYFTDCLTMGDLMGNFYGKYGEIITGFLSFFYSITVVGIQILYLVYICELLGISNDWGVSAIVFVVMLYTCFGGIRSVIITDAFHFVVLVVFTAVVANILIHQAGGVSELVKKVPIEKLNIAFSQEKAGYSAAYYSFPILMLWYLFPGFPLSGPFITRLLMSKGKKESVYVYYVGIAFLVVFFSLLTLIGLAAVVLDFPESVAKEGIIKYFIKTLPVGAKALALVGCLAFILSTIDSFFLSACFALTHNFIRPICMKQKIAINELRLVKYVGFITGIVTIGLVLYIRNVFTITAMGMDLAALLFTIPLIAGIMGLKTDAESFFVSVILTTATFIVSKLYWSSELAIPICIIVNIISFFTTHYVKNKGFITIKHTQYTEAEHLQKANLQPIVKKILRYFPTPSKIIKYSQNKVNAYGKESMGFSLFLSITYMIPYFMSIKNPQVSYAIMTSVRTVGVLLCVGLMFEYYWPNWLKGCFASYWHFTLLYCLPFSTTLLFLIEPNSTKALLNVVLSNLLLVVLVDWLTFVIISLLGVGGGVLIYSHIGSFNALKDINAVDLLIYTIFFSTLIGLLFARRKERYNTTQLRKAKLYAGSIAHETKNYLSTALFAADSINQAIRKKQLKPLEEGALQNKENLYTLPKPLAKELMWLAPELATGARQSASKIDMFMQALKSDIISTKLILCSIRACTQEGLNDGYFKREDVEKGLVLRLDDDFKAKVPKNFFKHIIYNLVKNAYYHGGATQVLITLDAAKRTLCIQDNGEGINSASLPYIFDLFYSGGHSSGIGLALVKVIVEAFGGRIHCSSKQGKESYTRFTVFFPEV